MQSWNMVKVDTTTEGLDEALEVARTSPKELTPEAKAQFDAAKEALVLLNEAMTMGKGNISVYASGQTSDEPGRPPENMGHDFIALNISRRDNA